MNTCQEEGSIITLKLGKRDQCTKERSPIHVGGNNPNVEFIYLSTR